MKKTRTRPGARSKKGATHTICCTDEEWELVREGAARAGMSASAWWTECALTVDPSPKGGKAQPLVLDAERQRGLSDGVAELARGLNADGVSQAQADIRAMLAEPLQRMVQEGRRARAMELLREVFGEERAAVIAAAFIPETPSATQDKPAANSARTNDAGRPEFREDA